MLDSGVYQDVEADSSANVQALGVIVASAVARAGFVALLGWLIFFGISVVAGGFVSTGL